MMLSKAETTASSTVAVVRGDVCQRLAAFITRLGGCEADQTSQVRKLCKHHLVHVVELVRCAIGSCPWPLVALPQRRCRCVARLQQRERAISLLALPVLIHCLISGIHCRRTAWGTRHTVPG